MSNYKTNSFIKYVTVSEQKSNIQERNLNFMKDMLKVKMLPNKYQPSLKPLADIKSYLWQFVHKLNHTF